MSSPFIARYVASLKAYQPGEQPRGGGIVKLNTNENPYPPSPRVGEALAEFEVNGLRRYPDPMAVALRRRIAEIHACDLDCVFAGNGSDEVLALATRAFVEDDGSIGYFEPSYSLYPVLTDIRGVERRPVALDDDFGWRMPADYQASLFFLAQPNAPTGQTHDVKRVAEFAKRLAGVMLVDEAYADFADVNCMALATEDANRNQLVSRTLSKSFSLAGLRLGYAVGPPELIEAMYKVKDSYNLDALTQVLALAALQDLEHMRANVKRIRTTRARLTRELRHRGWIVLPSGANFVFARPTGIDAATCFDRLRNRKIFVRHFPGPRTGGFLRISIGTDAEIDQLLATLTEIDP